MSVYRRTRRRGLAHISVALGELFKTFGMAFCTCGALEYVEHLHRGRCRRCRKPEAVA